MYSKSQCYLKMPESCMDMFNIDLTSTEEGTKFVFSMKEKKPEQLSRLTKFAARIKTPVHYANLAWMSIVALNAYDAVTSMKEFVSVAKSWNNSDSTLEKAEKVISMTVNACNAVSDVGSIAVLFVGQAELEPVFIGLQMVCSIGGAIGSSYVEIQRLDSHIEMSGWEKLVYKVPFLSNKEALQKDLMVKSVYERYIFDTKGINLFDSVVISLPDIITEDFSEEEVKSSHFINQKKINVSSDLSVYLTYPYNPIVKL
uniref:Uncharacterized protein n=1 Tax=Ditylenchus dipsaci TaxID=166011 RepID=A0A915ELI8_9BILA